MKDAETATCFLKFPKRPTTFLNFIDEMIRHEGLGGYEYEHVST